VTLEWLAPPYAGGHWVPEMVELAGGHSVAGEPGRDSRVVDWDELRASRPEVAVAMPCGLYAEEAAEQALTYHDELEALGAGTIYAVDAASSFSRPGPRLVEGVELLGHLLHPGEVPAPDGLSFKDLSEEIGSGVRG
jgi:iron complex transport system substrate-binding protein